MKPDTQASNTKIDQLPVQGGVSIDIVPGAINPEAGKDSAVEKTPQRAEPGPISNDAFMTTALPTPVPAAPANDDNSVVAGAPVIAKDDDLIEKEWVDKAKQIVNQTKNDPHQRETGVTKLKVDYLKKRFGRDLGAAK